MKIQVNTDHSVQGPEPLVEMVENVVGEGLSRFSDRISRTEVHLTDVNAERAGDDKRCVIEVRPNGLNPLVTSDQANTVDKAVRSATHKMVALLNSTFGKLSSSH